MNYIKQTLAFIIITFCFAFYSNAQYNITFEIKNCTTDTLLLGYYWHGGSYAIDTAINKKCKFSFSQKDKTLEDGIYFFADTKGRFCEFIIYKDQNLQFKSKDENWIANMQVKGSENEELYINYLKQSDALGKQYNDIIGGRQSISKEEYENKLKKFSLQNDSLKNDFIQKYPNHLLTKILLCAKPIDIPNFDTIYKSDGSIDSVAMHTVGFCWYKKHYFDNTDFSYSGLLNTQKPIFMDNYNYYWDNVMKYEKADSILYYAEYWISKAKDTKMFDFLVKDITSRYLTDGIMGHDKVYVTMVDKFLKTGKFTAISPSDIEQNIQRADTWRNLLIGKQIPDLACPEKDENSPWHHLDELKNKYKILVFWSYECSHCTTEIPKIAEFYNKYKEKYDLGIFAVHTEGDIAQRDEFLKKHNIIWINTNGLFANYDWRKYFDIEKTPIIYILNSKDEILAKNISVDSLKQIMDILEQGGFNL